MSKIKVKDIEVGVLDTDLRYEGFFDDVLGKKHAYELAEEYRIIKEILFPLPSNSVALCIERNETGTYISGYTFKQKKIGHSPVLYFSEKETLSWFKDLIACGIIEVIECE